MKRQAEATIPTEWGNFIMSAYADSPDDFMPNVALVSEKTDTSAPVLVRIHSECFTGDVFHSRRCDCGEQLARSMDMIAQEGGALIYLRQEGRGIGLINKLKAYNLQDEGLNTADANTHLGFEVDARQYDMAISILKDLGIHSIRLLTNNPLKIDAIKNSDIHIVERVPIIINAQSENRLYLKAKKDVMGHLLDSLKLF
jgi:GTP cyclohydrolase II